MNRKKIRFKIEMSPELDKRLDEMSESEHTTKSAIMRKALLLMILALENKKKGNKLAFVDKNDNKVSDILGL